MNPLRTLAVNTSAFFSGFVGNPFKATAALPLPFQEELRPVTPASLPAPAHVAAEPSSATVAKDTGLFGRVLLRCMIVVSALALLDFAFGAEHIARRRSEILLYQQLRDKESERQRAEDDLRYLRATLAIQPVPPAQAPEPRLVTPHQPKLRSRLVHSAVTQLRQAKAKTKRL